MQLQFFNRPGCFRRGRHTEIVHMRRSSTQDANLHDPDARDRSTDDLLAAAQTGDDAAKMQLVVNALPLAARRMRGRLPHNARDGQDTGDLLQYAALQLLQRRERFVPRHPMATQGYLCVSVSNRIRSELRRTSHRLVLTALDDELPSHCASPLTMVIRKELRQHIRLALAALRPKDRRILTTRATCQGSLADLAKTLGLPSPAAAGIALIRARTRFRFELSRLNVTVRGTA